MISKATNRAPLSFGLYDLGVFYFFVLFALAVSNISCLSKLFQYFEWGTKRRMSKWNGKPRFSIGATRMGLIVLILSILCSRKKNNAKTGDIY